MKLQIKLALYNAASKIAIILFMGIIIFIFLERITINHIDSRVIKKKEKVIANISDAEIDSLLESRKTFTDYNILKEEFIVLDEEPFNKNVDTKMHFSTDTREIEGDTEYYRILNYRFNYDNRSYKMEIGESMTGVEQLKQTIRLYTFIVLIIAISLTLITDYAFISHLLKPFYLIIDKKINKVNDPIHYNYQHIETNTSDFRLLDNSINSLMKKISDLFVLEKQFIANVSHELMTPISILTNRLENILNEEEVSPLVENKIYASLKTLNRLKSIINSLLLISKIENYQYNKQDTIILANELSDIHEELEDRIADKQLSYTCKLSQPFKFKCNKALMHTLLINLINNAIKYNTEGSSIAITDQPGTNEYILVITDKGIGMDPTQIEQAFNRFVKLNNEVNESHGLGLAIVKSIADFHNIRIDVTSVKGEGTQFRLFFPA